MSNLENINNPLACVQNWYAAQCNGDWEHNYGVKIETTDNPGWYVEIDLTDTVWDAVMIPFARDETSESEWIQFEVRDGRFRGSGSVANLDQVLLEFLAIVKR